MSNHWDKCRKDLETDFQKIKDKFLKQLQELCVNRLSPSLISHIKIDIDNQMINLEQIANIFVNQARVFVIKPYDTNSKVLSEIDKSIRKAKPDFNPMISNDEIKIEFPKPTQEIRERTAKTAKKFLEDSKILLRNSRKNCMNILKDDSISKDEVRKFQNNLDKEIKKYSDVLDGLFKEKSKELMTI